MGQQWRHKVCHSEAAAEESGAPQARNFDTVAWKLNERFSTDCKSQLKTKPGATK
jgi:predicted CxxxxCH...CXXCH cytochrome family protein